MDSLDIRLLRAMFRGQVFNLQGVDPRLSIQYLARMVGTSRITAGRRLARWREEGFWKGVVAFPNPALLGTSFQMQALVLEAARDRSRLESALERILEPVISFQTEDFYTPLLFSEPPARSERRQRELREIGLSRILTPPLDVPFVPSDIKLGPRDWKIIQSLRRSPEPDWPSVAREVKITVRGLERRVDRLMAGGALFFFPELDFRRSPGTVATVGLLFGPGVDLNRMRTEVTRRYPDLLAVEQIFPFEIFLPPGGSSKIAGAFQFFLPAPSASSSDQLRRDFGAVPGVVDVIIGFPTQDIAPPRGLNSRIRAAIKRLPARG
jgi:DNA-binding Lrp family transcriptional regulator